MYIISIYSFLRSFMPYQFIELNPNILNNPKIREPQIESYQSIINYFNKQPVQEREVGIILPVGCGKSGVISLIPFALKSKKNTSHCSKSKYSRSTISKFCLFS